MVAVGSAGLVVFVYLIGVLGIGVYASRFTEHTPSDFYVAGRTLGTTVLTFTLIATVLSSFTVFAIGAATSGSGLGLYAFIGLAAPFYALFFLVTGIKLYKVGIEQDLVTPPEYLRGRYDSQLVPVVFVILMAVFLIPYIAVQIIGGGVALESVLGIDYVLAIGGITLFMMAYIHIAGMRGVVWSDLVQGLMLFGLLVLMFFLVNATIGGNALVQDIIAENPEIFTLRGPAGVWTPKYILSNMLAFAIGIAAMPQIYQRWFATNSVDIVERSAILYAVVVIVINFVASILGVWSLGIIEVDAIPSPDYLIPFMIEALTNPIVFGIAMAAGIAALMSTADSQALTLSSMVGRDVYREYVDQETSEEREIRVTQGALIVTIVLAFLLAWTRPSSIFQLAEVAISGFAATAPPVFLGIYWRHGTAAGAIASMVIGTLTLFVFYLDVVPSSYQFGLHYGFFALSVSFIVYVAVSMGTDLPPAEAIRDYQ